MGGGGVTALMAAGVVPLLFMAGAAGVRASRLDAARGRARTRLEPGATRRWPPGSRWCSAVTGRLDAHRALRRYEEALPDALDHLAAGLRTGGSTVQALSAAAARSGGLLGTDLTAVVRGLERGASLDDALAAWRRRRPLHAVTLTASALELGSHVGGRQAGAVDTVGDAVRQRLALRREVRALSAQARASAWVMSATPLGFAAVAAALDPRVATVLLASPLGWACLAGGMALDGAAAFWMARIVSPTREVIR